MSEEEDEEEKERAVAVCENCDQPVPVRVWPDETIHPIGGRNRCCAETSYRVVEDETPSEFMSED